LSYLRRYPIDKIKIDRSFITGLGVEDDAAAVVGAIVSLAHSLKLKVIAEGVETHVQRVALSAAGCDDVQGFLTGRPMDAPALEQLLLASVAPRSAARSDSATSDSWELAVTP